MIRFRCCLNWLFLPVLFLSLAVVYVLLALLAEASWCLIPAGMCLCVSLPGIWAAQWVAEFSESSIRIYHLWSGAAAEYALDSGKTVLRIYQRGEFLLFSDRPLEEKEALTIWRRTFSPRYAGAQDGCFCVRVASPRRMKEITALLSEQSIPVPEKWIKGPWQL